MEVFRISRIEYAGKLSSSSRENRWNKDGEYVIYTSASRSLSTLELIVHKNFIKPLFSYKVMVISLADDDGIYRHIRIGDLPADWRLLSAYSALQKIGSAWYSGQDTLILKTPSAVIPNEHNYIINIKHPDFKKNVKFIRNETYFWDERLV